MSSSWYEATARERIDGLIDPGSFIELLPPQDRVTSPHLRVLGSPAAFDDGVAVGKATLDGKAVLIAAQEGAFMGGAVGEVHGAKITGLLERALDEKPSAVLLLLESGGVRLHEANAGLIAVSEIMRAILNLRAAGVPVIVLDGGRYGVFGGMGIASRLCSSIVMSEEGRLGLSGPEVIETTMGVEEFDASDRALVWRTVGGKNRYILGETDGLVSDDMAAFREAAIALLGEAKALDLNAIEAEHADLVARLTRFGGVQDATDIWSALDIADVEQIPLMTTDEFHYAVDGRRSA
ncbi:biotin-independent malonate decarboxylase subunit beta [Agrobacterium rubi]|uniref:Biotin-independent malonate decarboxylase subunit beta n=2 Tax=Agrobacterium rubi TaxID=28099 RepID=A0AAE7USC0_9HYPH|nr:biotin-independent malonate decarboxylase subunit beta [Agrobacterium rubi]MBP1880908.1 malonate decarboxylase beta subunit [Agrobacterium rubi]NTE89030.1 biotin-independent malonate decarboxylase subunit beta [Agrobacterium rubi]NTF04251.1 biotin-independent malonate decarboxylase subunit beta [Agrobacterium rubi]NTF38582.1 biotin-independent malonate decarboxylase subunit beta [Agrobacterium rubi]OCJ47236.1 biotin-independent malonate decarboxylase subunit beta [Agrobacterium rubi]